VAIEVPASVHVRLDDEQRLRIAAWIAANDVEQISTAFRALLDLGLTRAESVGPELMKRMVREGFTHGYGAFLERLSPLIAEMKAETSPK
jgi:hypothetical protein